MMAVPMHRHTVRAKKQQKNNNKNKTKQKTPCKHERRSGGGVLTLIFIGCCVIGFHPSSTWSRRCTGLTWHSPLYFDI